MNSIFKYISYFAFLSIITLNQSCVKDKNSPQPATPPAPIVDVSELITSFRIIFTDSASGSISTFSFIDPDGEGGQPAYYGPTISSQSDSVIELNANKTYYSQIILLDESKSPIDSISNEVNAEGKEHMFFYNNGANTILNSNNPYTVILNGSNVEITYTDFDQGSPQRGIGLRTRFRTGSVTAPAKYPLNITLRHQPGTKNGTYAPGESDISVDFKLRIN